MKFKNFLPSIFLILYVPLFCFTPLIYHFILGGALTIDHKTEGLVYNDFRIYLIYHIYNILMLLSFIFFSSYFNIFKKSSFIKLVDETFQQKMLLILLLSFGLFLYVDSTGMSLFELLIAGRFTWFENPNYNSIESVAASYFISLSPILIFIFLKNKNILFLVLTFLILILYGILSKDRKWVIFIISGLISFIYYLNGNRIFLKPRIVFISFFFGLILVFWQVFRDVLFNELLTGRGDFFLKAKEMGESLLIKGDFPYYYFSSITAIKMNFIDGFNIPFGIIRRQLFFMIPANYSFGLKIKDISAIFSDALDAGDQIRGGNMPPGFIGLFVLSFKWWGGILFYIQIPFLLFYLNQLFLNLNSIFRTVFYSNCFSFIILLLRGDDSSAFYFFIFNLLIFYLIYKIFKKSIC